MAAITKLVITVDQPSTTHTGLILFSRDAYILSPQVKRESGSDR